MKTNFRPERVAFLDFETQSEHDLTKSTTRKYARDPSTKALTCVVKVDNQLFKMGPYLTDNDKATLSRIAETHTIVAHNAPFDAAIWEDTLGLPEAEWFDTLPCARAAGLPGGLDKLSKAIGGRGKHKDGERLIKMLCCVKNGKIPAIGPAHQLLMDYNVQDVEELETIYSKVKDFVEPDVMTVDHTINVRGVPIDVPYCEALLSLYDQNAKESGDAFDDHTDGVNPRSTKQMVEYLQRLGFNVDKSNKVLLTALQKDPSSFYVGDGDLADEVELMQEAIRLRSELTGVGRGKIKNALEAVDEGRLYDMFVYFAGHTGRWGGRKVQFHNMPSVIRGMDIRKTEVTLDAFKTVIAAYREKYKVDVSVSAALGMAIRRMVKGSNILCADYASIEARCLAWIADDPTMLARYRDPHGPTLYQDMGKHLFHRDITKSDVAEYILSKALVLGCGYQMSGKKFEKTLILREGVAVVNKLRESGVDPAEAVKTYRKTYPMVPILWTEMNKAAISAIKGVSEEYGKVFFHMEGRDLHAVLPSGRPFVFRNARVEMVVPSYCEMYGIPPFKQETIVYDSPRGATKFGTTLDGGGGIGFLYAGKIVENICQAIARDLLADALVKCEAAGLNPIIHVHDEIVCDTSPDRLNELLNIMSKGPDWAEGFPILVEGYSGPQWTKSPGGYHEAKSFDGRML